MYNKPQRQAPIAADGLYVIILAAGQARRFGAPKQLARIDDRSLIAHAIDGAAALVAKGDILIITGAHRAAVEAEVAGAGVQIIYNRHWQAGMGTSIACGIHRLPKDAKAALIMACDQALLGARQLYALMRAWRARPGCIIASAYAGTAGIPVIIPAAFFAELRTLPPAAGAKALLHEQKKKVVYVNLPQAAYDIDSKEDMSTIGNSD